MDPPPDDMRWFRRVGLPLDALERAELATIVCEPGSSRNTIEIDAPGSWSEAARILASEDRDNRRWDAEEAERERLWDALADRFTEDELLGRIDAVCAGDPQFVADATGAAQLALHHGALATLAGEDPAHSFHRTLRLFACGRWPLAIDERRLIVF